MQIGAWQIGAWQIGAWTGSIRTLTTDARVRLVSNDDRTHDNARPSASLSATPASVVPERPGRRATTRNTISAPLFEGPKSHKSCAASPGGEGSAVRQRTEPARRTGRYPAAASPP